MSAIKKKRRRTALRKLKLSDKDDETSKIKLTREKRTAVSALKGLLLDINGVKPIHISAETQVNLNCVVGKHINENAAAIYVSKEAILNDINEQNEESDFFLVKEIILEYPHDDVLLMFDYDEPGDGEMFLLCLNDEAAEYILEQFNVDKLDEDKKDDDIIPSHWPDMTYKFPEPKPWKSLGSEKEVDDEQVISKREKITMKVSRNTAVSPRRVILSDRSACEDAFEIPPVPDIERRIYCDTVDRGVQAVTLKQAQICQTELAKKKNAAVQYEPRKCDETEDTALMTFNMEKAQAFALRASVPMLLAIKENISSDIFKDDWLSLGEKEAKSKEETDDSMKEFLSFTSLLYSKGKRITHVSWHPTIQGIIAMSCVEACSFYERIDELSRINLQPHLIIFWSFIDPTTPKLFLEAPDDVLHFQFNPSNPDLLAGGCINGQFVLWDLSENREELRKMTEHQQQKKSDLFIIETSKPSDIPIVKFTASSSAQYGHHSGILHLEWLPNNVEVGDNGLIQWANLKYSVQVITAGADSNFMFWDLRLEKHQTEDLVPKRLDTIANSFSALDLIMKPFHSFKLLPHPKAKQACITTFKIDLREVKAKQSVASENGEEEIKTVPTSTFIAGTINGEILHGDWCIPCDQTGQPTEMLPPVYFESVIGGYINTIEASPFINNVCLIVGGWKMAIWHIDIKFGPLLQSPFGHYQNVTGHWSLTRPGVIFIGLDNGSLEAWDLLSMTHQPVQVQYVSSSPITKISPQVLAGDLHILAVSDSQGTLHIIRLPCSLWSPVPNEQAMVEAYFNQEMARLTIKYEQQLEKEKQKAEEREIERIEKERLEIERERSGQDKPVELDKEATAEEQYKGYLKLEITSLVELKVLPPSALEQIAEEHELSDEET